MRLVTKLRYQLSDQWGVFGGGVFMFSPETGADWGDSFTGGGLVGVDFRHSKTLFVSLGVAVVSQIEDDASVTPSVILNWLPHERWAVRIGAVPASGGAAAAGEVAYRVANPLEIGVGLLYNQRRFRLDDSGRRRMASARTTTCCCACAWAGTSPHRSPWPSSAASPWAARCSSTTATAIASTSRITIPHRTSDCDSWEGSDMVPV